jgi:hypothetical protein
MMRHILGIALIVGLTLAPLGCRPHRDVSEFSSEASRVEHFRQRQSATELTHGRIRMDSVEEASDGRVRYQTSDGKTWLVDMTPDANGGYRYGTPEEVK